MLDRDARDSQINKIFHGSKSGNTKGVEIIEAEQIQALLNSCQHENIVTNKEKKMEINKSCVWKRDDSRIHCFVRWIDLGPVLPLHEFILTKVKKKPSSACARPTQL